MAEPMVIDVGPDEQYRRAWLDLWPVRNPHTFMEVHKRCDAFLTTGFFFCLMEPVKLRCNATSIGREKDLVVTATVARIVSVEQNPTMVTANFLVPASDYPQFPALAPIAPNDRTYLEYPPELV